MAWQWGHQNVFGKSWKCKGQAHNNKQEAKRVWQCRMQTFAHFCAMFNLCGLFTDIRERISNFSGQNIQGQRSLVRCGTRLLGTHFPHQRPTLLSTPGTSTTHTTANKQNKHSCCAGFMRQSVLGEREGPCTQTHHEQAGQTTLLFITYPCLVWSWRQQCGYKICRDQCSSRLNSLLILLLKRTSK